MINEPKLLLYCPWHVKKAKNGAIELKKFAALANANYFKIQARLWIFDDLIPNVRDTFC